MRNLDFTIKYQHNPKECKGIHSISQPIKRYSDIRDEAERMVKWLNDNNGSFPQPYSMAYAVSHCQVVEDPYRFFVVNEEMINSLKLENTKERNKKNFYFPDQAIFNAEIIEVPEKIKRRVPSREVTTDKDGKVGHKIVVKDGWIDNKVYVPDACMSFVHRGGKKTERYYRIKVKYQTRGIFGMFRTHIEWVEALKAHIFQHETDHFQGINIYHSKKK